MQVFLDIQESITTHKDKKAFFINEVFYTYHDLAFSISKIRKAIQNTIPEIEKNIGLVANDDLETYAAIIALWFEGKAYIPINPETPVDRNASIINQAFITTVIDSSGDVLFPKINTIQSCKLGKTDIDLEQKLFSEEQLVYILFTSGTTGVPKGVPITRANLNGFISAFWEMGFQINEEDKCLQMFELTFDLSVMSYLIPILKGACVYTIPKEKVKYSYIFELMDEQKLTVALMVPSILHFLRPYFIEIDLPEMKYSLFCGEALPLDITEEWAKCLPNAQIVNVYGPTEDTIFCTYYNYIRNGINKSHNGILSIGKAMAGNSNIIINENNQIISSGIGELCLAGRQLTPGYWHNDLKNSETFFKLNHDGIEVRYYRTGDLCQVDNEGDILYHGRLDFQTKIQGFRVELSEIEFHAKYFLKRINVVVLAMIDPIGNTELGMIIESKQQNSFDLLEYLKTKLPSYMVPKKIAFIDVLPLNVNGKIDRKKLEFVFKK
jgi:D-alanine--poly(phosphoribitol) ligase subunit 1